jgi:hypothetical protein
LRTESARRSERASARVDDGGVDVEEDVRIEVDEEGVLPFPLHRGARDAGEFLLLGVHVGADSAADDRADGGAGQDLVRLTLACEDGCRGAGGSPHSRALPGAVALGGALLRLGAGRRGRGAAGEEGEEQNGGRQAPESLLGSVG